MIARGLPVLGLRGLVCGKSPCVRGSAALSESLPPDGDGAAALCSVPLDGSAIGVDEVRSRP